MMGQLSSKSYRNKKALTSHFIGYFHIILVNIS